MVLHESTEPLNDVFTPPGPAPSCFRRRSKLGLARLSLPLTAMALWPCALGHAAARKS